MQKCDLVNYRLHQIIARIRWHAVRSKAKHSRGVLEAANQQSMYNILIKLLPKK